MKRLLLTVVVLAALALPARAQSPVLDNLTAIGWQFEALGYTHGLATYRGRRADQAQIFFVSPDGQAVFLGPAFDATGTDLVARITNGSGGGQVIGTLPTGADPAGAAAAAGVPQGPIPGVEAGSAQPLGQAAAGGEPSLVEQATGQVAGLVSEVQRLYGQSSYADLDLEQLTSASDQVAALLDEGRRQLHHALGGSLSLEAFSRDPRTLIVSLREVADRDCEPLGYQMIDMLAALRRELNFVGFEVGGATSTRIAGTDHPVTDIQLRALVQRACRRPSLSGTRDFFLYFE